MTKRRWALTIHEWMPGGWSCVRRMRGWDRGSSRPRRIIQLVLLAAIASAVVTSVPGVRAEQGSWWWMGGTWQLLAYGAAALLCLVRTPPPSFDRTVPRLVAVAVTFFGLSNLHRHEWLVRTLDPVPVTVLGHVLRAAFYICVLIAMVLLVRSRLDRLPLSLGLDGVVAALGAATIAALLAPELGGGFAQPADHACTPGGGRGPAYPRLLRGVVVPIVAATVVIGNGRQPSGVRLCRLHLCGPGRAGVTMNQAA